jgi:nucleolar protein 15
MVKREKVNATKTENKNKGKETKVVKPVEEEDVNDTIEEVPELVEDVIEHEKTGNKGARIKSLEKTIETLEANDLTTGVIYIGHLPWGFDDVGIKKYFEQFGKITRILVPRSKKVSRIYIF